MNTLYIYAPHFSPRLKYTLEFVFTSYIKVNYQLIDDLNEINKHRYPCVLNYSFETLPVHDFWIKPHDLLSQNGISPEIELHTDYRGPVPYFFANKNDDLGFDIFSAIFYLISRYEEYQPTAEFDKYGRYQPESSVLQQLKVLQKPVADYWMRWLFKAIQNKYPNLEMHKPAYRFISTLDIDNAYAFTNKGWVRQSGGLVKEIAGGRFQHASYRIGTWLNLKADPFDTYDYIFEIHKKHQQKPLLFFLVGDKQGVDTNLHFRNKSFRQLIKSSAKKAGVQLHNSYASSRKLKRLNEEKSRLENIIHQPVHKVRQHYLAIQLPQTYRNYHEAGISEDYSLGYASVHGFRAGTSFPFYFYDLQNEKQLDVLVYSSPIMEVTLQQYLQLEPREAIQAYETVINEIKKSDGIFVSLWHNESLSNRGEWKGWREVFEGMLERAK
ncbi:MAG: hypothetical protein GVY19_09770 [Bacteroidetes bacterium]|jgi:hypothetical protein|nr:hypothetical protein [Bacteroidota bacterium]